MWVVPWEQSRRERWMMVNQHFLSVQYVLGTVVDTGIAGMKKECIPWDSFRF